jgi:hypothetical protein
MKRVMASVSRFLTTKLRLKAQPPDLRFASLMDTDLRDTFARSHTWGLTEAEVDDLRPYLIGWRGFQFIGVDLCKLRKVSARSRGAGLGFHQCRLRIEIIAARNTGVQAA